MCIVVVRFSRRSNFGSDVLELENSHPNIAAGTKTISMLKLIIKRCAITEPPPDSLLQTARFGNTTVMKEFLKLHNAFNTNSMVIDSLQNSRPGLDVLKLLWSLAPDIEPALEMFVVAAKAFHEDPEDLYFLFARVTRSDMYQKIVTE